MDIHASQLTGLGRHVDFLGYALSLASLERLIIFFLYKIAINGGRFPLKIMIFELKVDQRGYNIQRGYEGTSQNAIVDALASDDEEFRINYYNVFSFAN